MLIIAHRLATVKNCDEIIVMDKGEVAEQGKHMELLEKKGLYYRLWEMQQGNFKIEDEADAKPDGEDIGHQSEDDDDTISYT